jgi:hypothetical protein
MRRLLCVLAFVATPAFANPPEAELNASHGALSDGLIADAGAEGVFEIVPAQHMIAVRHIRSGLICRMAPENANRLILFPRAARGEDVACETSNEHETVRLFATRFSLETNLDQQIVGAAAAIRAHFPNAQSYEATLDIASDSLPPSRTAQFLATQADGARLYTRASVAQIGDWMIKLRYTAPAPDDAAAREGERMSNSIWRAAFQEIRARP